MYLDGLQLEIRTTNYDLEVFMVLKVLLCTQNTVNGKIN